MENEKLFFEFTPKIEMVLDEKIEYYTNELEKYRQEWKSVNKYLLENPDFIEHSHPNSSEYYFKSRSKHHIKSIIINIEVLLKDLIHMKEEKPNPLNESELDIIYNGSYSLKSNLTEWSCFNSLKR
jgi:hypothetical protein